MTSKPETHTIDLYRSEGIRPRLTRTGTVAVTPSPVQLHPLSREIPQKVASSSPGPLFAPAFNAFRKKEVQFSTNQSQLLLQFSGFLSQLKAQFSG
jgi:hypothetical protein